MSTTMSALQPLRFPLNGSHLIEASAGTGKTFTIAALYVRLVLGHGREQAFARPLTPPEILVVTFTDAATQELRDRIRARLAEAAVYFRADPANIQPLPLGQDFLYDLRAEYPPEQWLTCARQLQTAAEGMDEAAVSTIHSWCNRMLREHAFDSLSLFTQNLETDQSKLLSECVRDYWRNHFYSLSKDDAYLVQSLWRDPVKLEETIKPLLAQVRHLPIAAVPDVHLQTWRQEKQTLLNQLKQPWSQWTGDIKELLDRAVEAKQVDGRKIQAGWYTSWLEKLDAWASDPDQDSLDIGAGWTRLTPKGLAEAWKVGEPPKHRGLDELAALKVALAQLPKPETGLTCHAAHWIAKAFEAAQKKRAQMGFDDLLTGLQQALQTSEHAQGERLAAVIRQQFPVALIDEFQDTDPVQYDIFQRVYPLSSSREDCSLILIGDPKQAIYAFRGADIYTYLQARQAVQGRLYTLGTNYRSTTEMVAAVNHCFNRCEQNTEEPGSFRFRRGDDNPVPFWPVNAQGRSAQFVADGHSQPALQLNVLDEESALSKGEYLTQMAALAASQIVGWLNLGQQGKAGFEENGQLQPLKPNDIAVLVNNATEAKHIRQALSYRGVRSVYLSDKESVYASPEAMEVYRWLLACAEPDNDGLLRAALSTPSLGMSFVALDELNQDECCWEARVEQFKTYRYQWQRHGVLPMLRNLLFDFGVIERLSQSGVNADGVNADGVSGERRLTDLLHLAELLQQASHNLEGEHALIRFLAEQLKAPAQDHRGHKVRLESDADLVKVVTIHKAKGLEYPVVFLPFICAARAVSIKDKTIQWHDNEGQLRVALDIDDDVLRQADEERIAEDLRKLYVALTRARYVTWVGLAPLKDKAASAMTYVLGLQDCKPEAWLSSLQDFAAELDAIGLNANPVSHQTPYIPTSTAPVQIAARQLRRPARDYWWIGSYSQLQNTVHADEVTALADDNAKAQNLLEALHEQAPPVLTEGVGQGVWHRFPKGAEAGTLIHELLEWIAQQGFAQVVNDPTGLRDLVARRCYSRGWQSWVSPLHDWLIRILQTPLYLQDAASPLCLQNLTRYQVEMEFCFEVHDTNVQRLDELVRVNTLQGRPRQPISVQRLNGLLKGFMDLVFEHDGRYYVVDYKTNWLGPHSQSYTTEYLDAAIRNHRYDLQYVLYVFALHRHLRTRLPDYDYERHVGGAVYLFLRGVEHEKGGVHFEKPPKALIERLDSLFIGQNRSVAI